MRNELDYDQEIIDAFRVMVDARKAYRKEWAPMPDELAKLLSKYPTAIYAADFNDVIDAITMIADAVALKELGTYTTI